MHILPSEFFSDSGRYDADFNKSTLRLQNTTDIFTSSSKELKCREVHQAYCIRNTSEPKPQVLKGISAS